MKRKTKGHLVKKKHDWPLEQKEGKSKREKTATPGATERGKCTNETAPARRLQTEKKKKTLKD